MVDPTNEKPPITVDGGKELIIRYRKLKIPSEYPAKPHEMGKLLTLEQLVQLDTKLGFSAESFINKFNSAVMKDLLPIVDEKLNHIFKLNPSEKLLPGEEKYFEDYKQKLTDALEKSQEYNEMSAEINSTIFHDEFLDFYQDFIKTNNYLPEAVLLLKEHVPYQIQMLLSSSPDILSSTITLDLWKKIDYINTKDDLNKVIERCTNIPKEALLEEDKIKLRETICHNSNWPDYKIGKLLGEFEIDGNDVPELLKRLYVAGLLKPGTEPGECLDSISLNRSMWSELLGFIDHQNYTIIESGDLDKFVAFTEKCRSLFTSLPGYSYLNDVINNEGYSGVFSIQFSLKSFLAKFLETHQLNDNNINKIVESISCLNFSLKKLHGFGFGRDQITECQTLITKSLPFQSRPIPYNQQQEFRLQVFQKFNQAGLV